MQVNNQKNRLLGWLRTPIVAAAMVGVGTLISGQVMAQFAPPPNTIGLTIEGCRNDGSPPITPGGTLPNAEGRFVCQDPAPLGGSDNPYTTGNLGKGWNELDLVPHRLILTNSSDSQQVYNVQIAADYENGGTLGYDVITEPEVISSPDLNAFSDAGCAVTSTPFATVPDVTGGAGQSIYRTLTITHPPRPGGNNTSSTCVIDFAMRLAVGASNFPGSSLQSYKFESADFQQGKATISIPVREIQPQELSKDMTATQDSEFAWNLTKQATPATVNLGNTCAIDNPNQAPVSVRVEWEILPGAPGMVMVVTNIYAKNPASRPITVNVSDTIFGDLGAGKVALDTTSSGDVVVAANTEVKVLEHTFDAPAHVTDLMDTATATYTDTATGIPVPGQTTAMASAMIQPGTQTNTSATITDTESISGNSLQYSADSVVVGSASGNFTVNGAPYTLGTKLDKDSFDLLWTSVQQNGDTTCADPEGCPVGFVEFNKTVYVSPVPTITSGTLSDTARLTASDGFTASSGPATINITSNALVELTLVKNIPDILQGDEEITCNFTVKDSSDNVVASPSFLFTAGETQEQTTLTGLAPDNYTVTEGSCGGLVPSGGTTQTVDLTLPAGSTTADCADMVTFTNIVGEGSAIASVDKLTFPAGLENGWEMTLTGPWTPDGGVKLTTSDSSAGDFEVFQDPDTFTDFLLFEGQYTVAEKLKPGWENTASSGCQFTVNYPGDFGKEFQCQFTNKQLGTIIINKVTDPTGGTGFGFTDNIEAPNAFTLDDGGTKTFLNVSAGTYSVTEDDPTPGYDLVGLVCNDGAVNNVVDSSTDLVNREATINLDPGETVECTFTNRQRGMVDLLKLTNGLQDQTMVWSFNLDGPQVNVSDSTPPPLVDFNGAKLIPGETYTVCEVGIPPSWTLQWAVDANNNDVIDDGETMPFVGGEGDLIGDGLYQVYDPDPNYGTDSAVNDSRCVNFQVNAGQTLSFILDNQRPGGDPRTPGYWKNWNTCTNGNQEATAEGNGGVAEGWFLLDDLIPTGVGDLVVDSCEYGVLILDHRSLDKERKMASDAAYNLARNLLAAKLNLAAGAETCGAVVDAVAAGDALLSSIGFDGTGKYLRPKDALYSTANSLAGTLDTYNNGNLCQ